jgi:hypothetical protein
LKRSLSRSPSSTASLLASPGPAQTSSIHRHSGRIVCGLANGGLHRERRVN